MLLEVPTGVISDLFGYKISMVLSVFCFIVSNIILIIFPTFAGVLLCEIFMMLGSKAPYSTLKSSYVL